MNEEIKIGQKVKGFRFDDSSGVYPVKEYLSILREERLNELGL